MITNVELTQMKERAEKATEGPWKWECETPSSAEELISENGDNVLYAGSSQNSGYVVTGDEDAQFIAHAREDVPRLVAEVERLQHEVGEHSAHNGHLIATEIIPTKEENKRLQAEVERLREALELAIAYVPAHKKCWEIAREALK